MWAPDRLGLLKGLLEMAMEGDWAFNLHVHGEEKSRPVGPCTSLGHWARFWRLSIVALLGNAGKETSSWIWLALVGHHAHRHARNRTEQAL